MDLIDLKVIKRASQAAARAHQGQVRKDGTTPYIVHPACVAFLVSLYGGSQSAIIAAWMHDIMEDCKDDAKIVEMSLDAMPLPLEEKGIIRKMVASLTKDRFIADEVERLRDSLFRISSAPPEATLVKLCDRIDNLIDAEDRDPSFIQRYLKETHEIIEILGDRAREYGYTEALVALVKLGDQMKRNGGCSLRDFSIG